MSDLVAVILMAPAKVGDRVLPPGPARVSEADALLLEAAGLVEREGVLLVAEGIVLPATGEMELRAQALARDLADAAVGGMELVADGRVAAVEAERDRALARVAELETQLASQDTQSLPSGEGATAEAPGGPATAGEATASPAPNPKASRRAAAEAG